jgi:hydroxymethylpyrimidine pyrophosphatase-like HAD family hydrolase
MIEYAGLSVWVDNRSEPRDKGDVMVTSNNNHGVAEW